MVGVLLTAYKALGIYVHILCTLQPFLHLQLPCVEPKLSSYTVHVLYPNPSARFHYKLPAYLPFFRAHPTTVVLSSTPVCLAII